MLGLCDSAGTDSKGQNGWDNCQRPPTVVINPKDCRCAGCDKPVESSDVVCEAVTT